MVAPSADVPECATAASLAGHDGRQVRLVGTYRRELVAKKMGEEPTLFLGTVVIEVEGRAADYDPRKWDGALALIQLGDGPRPDDEVAQFADRRVAVEGRLVLRPPPADPEAAHEDPAPTLFEPGAISLR